MGKSVRVLSYVKSIDSSDANFEKNTSHVITVVCKQKDDYCNRSCNKNVNKSSLSGGLCHGRMNLLARNENLYLD